MNYELDRIENIIIGQLPSWADIAVSVNTDSQPALISIVRQEVHRIKKQLLHQIFCFEDEGHLARYIQFHQQQLLRLTNELSILNRTSADANDCLYNACNKAIDDLLAFIEGHFPKYFDQDLKAPNGYLMLVAAQVETAITALRTGFTAVQLEVALQELAVRPLVNFVRHSSSGRLSYRDVIYVNEVKKALLQILTKDKNTDDFAEEVRQVLFFLNYNTRRYFRYFAISITSRLQATDADERALEILSLALKTIGQTQVKTGFAYCRSMPSLKEQVLDWVNEEILHLERTRRLGERPANEVTLSPAFKLKTDASVSQLAYLLRVFIETHFLHNKNTSDLMRFFTRFFQSKRLENISYESFRVRYYNPEDGAKNGVRGILLRMLDHINRS